MLTRLIAYVRKIVTRRQFGLESDDERRFHFEQKTTANVAVGLSPSDARRTSLRHMDGLTRTQKGVRDVRALWVDSVGGDLKYAVRTLLRAPGFTIVCLLVLALGSGANAAIFSIVDALLLRPLPFPDAERLVRIDGIVTRLPLRMRETGLELAYPIAVSGLSQSQAFTSIGSYSMSGLNFGTDRPERLRAAAVTP